MNKTIKTMIDSDDAVMLLIDHQSGLFQLVRDIEQSVLRSNVTALAKVARLAKRVWSKVVGQTGAYYAHADK